MTTNTMRVSDPSRNHVIGIENWMDPHANALRYKLVNAEQDDDGFWPIQVDEYEAFDLWEMLSAAEEVVGEMNAEQHQSDMTPDQASVRHDRDALAGVMEPRPKE